MNQDAPQRCYELREMFNSLRWIVRVGAPWRLLPNDFPPWEMVYQQTQRWIQAGCFEHRSGNWRDRSCRPRDRL
ncbi:transposase [Paraburkholderia sp. J69-1]